MNRCDPDLMPTLSAARPTDDDLAASWSADDRSALWSRISQETAAASKDAHPLRRSAWLAAAAAVVAAVAVPTVMGSGDASARDDLLRLALVAADSDGPVIVPGTLLHVKTESLQENSRTLGDGARLDTHRESWIRWDGRQWAVDTRPSAGWTEYHRFDAPTAASFGRPTPEFVAGLPGDPTALRVYLDETVSGSTSHDEALFVAISDLVNSRMLDPATFGAALTVLADVDGVETSEVVVDGRRAVEVSYARNLSGARVARESFTVDRETAQLLVFEDDYPELTYQSRTTLVEVVDAVPADVLATYDTYGTGARFCADGRELIGDGECAN